jgi:glycosyltransferase involved in cell wall biosynthesis
MKFHNNWLNTIFFAAFCILNAIEMRLQKQKIDLVSTYDPLKTGLIGVIVAKILGAKFAPEVKGVYTSPAEWVDNERSLVTKIKKTTYPMIMYIVIKSADGIRLLFKEQVDYFAKILSGKEIQYFPSYVAIDRFKNIREEKEILFIGYPFKRKGADILIKAFKKISNNHKDWSLKIIGWYPNAYEIDKAISNHPNIRRLNPVPNSKIADHIGTCAVLVLPSRSEAMGRVLVEAMAAGKPRIGANVDGIPTVIEDGVDGLLFESENIDDLAKKLEILIKDSKLRKKLGRNGEIRAKKYFTRERYIANLNKFYTDVIKSSRLK